MKTTNERPTHLAREFDRPLYVASHFGFVPIEAPRVSDEDMKILKDSPNISRASELAALLRTYTEKNFTDLPHPLCLSYRRRGHLLHILGFSSALAESILIRTGLSILTDLGHKRLVVEINSIGDKDSMSAHEHELHNYVKKVSNDLSADHKKMLKEDILHLFNLDIPEHVRDAIPPSLASLTSLSRAHFKETLEYLETLGVEFRLAHHLLHDRDYASHTVFSIRDEEDQSVLAVGSRYSRLSRKLGFKKEMPAVYLNITASKKPAVQKTYKDLPKAKFYLVHLGREAKMRSLPLIETLRIHHIPVYHFLGKDKIVPQLQTAESLRVPYLLIIGQKEALENSVTVRNCSTRAQETVRMCDLPTYLKNIPF